MTELDKWKVVKYIAFAFIALMTVVLTIQFVNLAKLNRENYSTTSEINTLNEELQQKTEFEQTLKANYEGYVEEQAKENLNMKNPNEEVVIGKN